MHKQTSPSQIRVDLKGFILPAAAAAVVITIMLKMSELQDIDHLLHRVNLWWLAVASVVQLGHYISQAWLFAECYSLSGYPVRLGHIIGYVLGFTAINRLAPTGGATGSAYVVTQTTHDNVPIPSGVLAVAMSYAFDYITFISFIAGTLLYLSVHHQLRRSEIIAFMILVLLITGVTALVWMVIRARSRLEKILEVLAHNWNRLAKRDIDAQTLSDNLSKCILENWAMISSRRRIAWRTLPPAYVMHALDVATLYFIFRSFGLDGHIGVVTIGYCIAWLLSLATLIPSGLGVFEVSMATIYKTYGIPLEAAVLVTGAYRLLSFWLPIPIGLAAIHFVKLRNPQ